MQRQVLKSQIDRAHVTEVALDGEEGIEIPAELLEEAGLCEGERVLVVSRTTGTRLETPVRVGNATTGRIILSGAAAHRIGRGERVVILAFGISHEPVLAQKLVLNERNENPHRWH